MHETNDYIYEAINKAEIAEVTLEEKIDDCEDYEERERLEEAL